MHMQVLGISDEPPDLVENFKPSKISTPKSFKSSKHISNKGNSSTTLILSPMTTRQKKKHQSMLLFN